MRGRKSHYNPAFSEDDLNEARSIAQAHHTPHAKVVRARLALLLADNPGITHTEAAAKLAIHEETVLKWRRRWCRDGFCLDDNARSGRPPSFSPIDRAAVRALACERPADSEVPLRRYSIADITEIILEREIVPAISTSTVHRWLNELAIKPWQVRSWIFPRDPQFDVKATRVLDLYEGYWDGKPLGPRDVVLSLDEKTCIQALQRR